MKLVLSLCTSVLLWCFVGAENESAYNIKLVESINRGEVRHLSTQTRNFDEKIEVVNSQPRLVILCYAPGLTVRNFLSLWRSVTFSITSEGETSLIHGYSKVDVYRQWKDDYGTIRSWLMSWKVDRLTVSPFNTTCIGIISAVSFDIKLAIKAVDPWYVGYFFAGLLLFFSARRLSANVVFYYASGVSVGVLASVLILLFVLCRFIPKKSAAVGVLAMGFSFTTWLVQSLIQNFRELLDSYFVYFVAYFVIAGVTSFAVCYYKGPVTNPRLHDLIKWLIQIIGFGLIYGSSYMPEVAVALFVILFLLSLLPRQIPFSSTIKKYWLRKFPPKIKLLTEEEYINQGIIETQKALEDLRRYCQSPECDKWKTISRLSSPNRFASFIEGKSEHLSSAEMSEHDLNPSPNLSSYENFMDDDD